MVAVVKLCKEVEIDINGLRAGGLAGSGAPAPARFIG